MRTINGVCNRGSAINVVNLTNLLTNVEERDVQEFTDNCTMRSEFVA